MSTAGAAEQPAGTVRARGTAVHDLELSDPQDLVRDPAAWSRARVLVRLHGVPLGEVVLPLREGRLDAADAVAAAASRFGPEVEAHRCEDGAAPVGAAVPWPRREHPACGWLHRLGGRRPAASVVITTVGNRPELVRCLAEATAQRYRPAEVLVVDNSPLGSDAVRRWCAAAAGEVPVRYLHEPRPGLSRARNAGLAASRGEVVAFTDDDVTIDPDWLGWLVAPLAGESQTVATTGLILPADLRTRAQQLFEEFGGYAKGYRPALLDAGSDPDDPLHPYRLGRYGSGASSAWRASALTALGGFDKRLGAGTPTAGGEDLEVFVRAVLAGHRIAYEPRALVRHPSHGDEGALRRQVHAYGRGLGAVLAALVLESTAAQRRAMRARARVAAMHMFSARSAKNAQRSADYPRSLVLLEAAGVVRGAAAFVRTRRPAPSP